MIRIAFKLMLLMIALCLALQAGCRRQPPRHRDITQDQPAELAAPHETWPQFRGSYQAVAHNDARPPVGPDLLTHLRWKTPAPAGNSSPVVWGDRVFLTADGNRILCYSAATGIVLWDVALAPSAEPDEIDVYDDTGLAAPTACTDGVRVYALFGSGIIGAVDITTGRTIWSKRLVERPTNTFGLAASPILHDGRLIVVVDQGGEDDGESFMVALSPIDGRELWRADRPVGSGWATPVIIRTPERTELVTAARPWVIAYDPTNGAELWRAGRLSGDAAATPIYCDGIVVALSDPYGGPGLGIRPGGQGDVTETHVAWRYDRDLPDVASPICLLGRVYIMGERGTLTCLSAADGEMLFRTDLPGHFWASPVATGERLYFVSDDGMLLAVSPQDGSIFSRTQLNERIVATPAIAGDGIFIRSSQHLWRLND